MPPFPELHFVVMPPRRDLPLYIPAALPCFPCPHDAACCAQGTILTKTEAVRLAKSFGTGAITHLSPKQLQNRGWFDNDAPAPAEGAWATVLNPKTNRCVLYDFKRGCLAHDHKSYPAQCKAFPRKDLIDPELPQAWDARLCPEVG